MAERNNQTLERDKMETGSDDKVNESGSSDGEDGEMVSHVGMEGGDESAFRVSVSRVHI